MQEQLIKNVSVIYYLVPILSFIGFFMAFLMYRNILLKNNKIVKINKDHHLNQLILNFFKIKLRKILLIFSFFFIIFYFITFYLNLYNYLFLFIFILGCFFSAISGFIGVKIASNIKIDINKNSHNFFNDIFSFIFKICSINGLIITSLGIFNIFIFYCFIYYIKIDIKDIPILIFMCGIGGAVYSFLFKMDRSNILDKNNIKSIDKLNKIMRIHNINISIYGTYCLSMLSVSILGIVAFSKFNNILSLNSVIFPVLILGSGIIVSILGVYSFKIEKKNILTSINESSNIASIFMVIVSAIITKIIFPNKFNLFYCILIGIAINVLIAFLTEKHLYNDNKENFLRSILISIIYIFIICLSIFLSFLVAKGFSDLSMGFYGIGLCLIGLLSNSSINIAIYLIKPLLEYLTEKNNSIMKQNIVKKTTFLYGKLFSSITCFFLVLTFLSVYLINVKIGIRKMCINNILQSNVNLSNSSYIKSHVNSGFFINDVKYSLTKIKNSSLEWFIKVYNIRLLDIKAIIGILLGIILLLIFLYFYIYKSKFFLFLFFHFLILVLVGSIFSVNGSLALILSISISGIIISILGNNILFILKRSDNNVINSKEFSKIQIFFDTIPIESFIKVTIVFSVILSAVNLKLYNIIKNFFT